MQVKGISQKSQQVQAPRQMSGNQSKRALNARLQVYGLDVSGPALTLDDVIEISVGDFPVAVVMITASEKGNSIPVVAACPLVGISDLAVILATLQATTRTVSSWLAWGDRPPGAEGRD